MQCGPNEGQMSTVQKYAACWMASLGLLTSGSGRSKLPSTQEQIFLRDKYMVFGRDLGCQSQGTAGAWPPNQVQRQTLKNN